MLPHIVGDSKSRRMRQTGHVLCLECIQDFDEKHYDGSCGSRLWMGGEDSSK